MNEVSLQEMLPQFEGFTGDELEIACEITIPVTISVYRGRDNNDVMQSTYCHIQFEGGDGGYWARLVGPDQKLVADLKDVAEAFSIPMDKKVWEICEDEPFGAKGE